MFSSKSFIVVLACTLLTTSVIHANCADAYTSASYGLSHSKKAFKANNFDHQQYYAGRALEALEKTRDLVKQCGCEAALEAIDLGIESLEEALDPTDWEMGRYFTKKAMQHTYSVLDNLDLCTMDDSPADTSSADRLQEPDLTHKEQASSQKEAEAEALIAFDAAAKEHLQKVQEKVAALSQLLGCDHTEHNINLEDTFTPLDLTNTSLEEAKSYYKERSLALYKQALIATEDCNEKEE